MVGFGRVPGIEAGIGCRCRLCSCSSDDNEPGTGLEKKGREKKELRHIKEKMITLNFKMNVKTQNPSGI